jgi:proteasome accessory factor B
MFERDKDELRASGIPIQTITTSEGETVGYRLARQDFYLPYLSLVSNGRRSPARRVDREGYHALAQLAFEPDELAAVAEAARRAQALGDAALAADAAAALRKLTFDLPLDGAGGGPAPLVAQGPAIAPELFSALGEALERRKRVAFRYHSMHSDAVSTRTVEPYGLFYLGQHWYLAAAAPGEKLVKNYRLSRMSHLRVNRQSPGTPDFRVPGGFRLREHARSRQAWELGAGDGIAAVVRFTGGRGATMAARTLGDPVQGAPEQRRFVVRRVEVFARWLLSFGGDAEPLDPPSLREAVTRLARETLARYREGAHAGGATA